MRLIFQDLSLNFTWFSSREDNQRINVAVYTCMRIIILNRYYGSTVIHFIHTYTTYQTVCPSYLWNAAEFHLFAWLALFDAHIPINLQWYPFLYERGILHNHTHSYMMKEAFFTIISIHILWRRHSPQLYPFIHDEGGTSSLYPICAHHAQLDLLDNNVRTRAKKIPLKLIAEYKARNMRMENTSRQNYLHVMKIVFTTPTNLQTN